MTISSKIKAIINLKGSNNKSVAKCLDITPQAISNKLYRGSFTATDLIKIATCLGVELVFWDSANNQKIKFDMSDITNNNDDERE